MPIQKPDQFPEFAMQDQVDSTSGKNNVVEPDANYKSFGWTLHEKPARQFFNWLHRKTANWIQWFDQEVTKNTQNIFEWEKITLLLHPDDYGSGFPPPIFGDLRYRVVETSEGPFVKMMMVEATEYELEGNTFRAVINPAEEPFVAFPEELRTTKTISGFQSRRTIPVTVSVSTGIGDVILRPAIVEIEEDVLHVSLLDISDGVYKRDIWPDKFTAKVSWFGFSSVL